MCSVECLFDCQELCNEHNLPHNSTAMIENERGECYRLLGTLGSGAAADMFLAEDLSQQRCCALKKFEGSHSSVEFALKEAAIIQGIRHPHVVQCIDFFYRGTKELFLVYEYMEGGSLRDLMQATHDHFNVENAVECMGHILSGVSALHRLNVIHCDLKPENILIQYIDRRPVYKVADFDVAVFVKELPETDFNIEGSPAYMAPERFGDRFSLQSDLYSVGVIFYELLVGERPFAGNTLQLMRAHQRQQADFSRIKDVKIRGIVETLMHKDPGQRFGSAEAALQALQPSERAAGNEALGLTANRHALPPRRHRELGYPLCAPASSGSLEELTEFALPGHADWVYVAHFEDAPFLGLVNEYKLGIYEGISGKNIHAGKNWMNFEVRPLNPHTLAYRTQYSICSIDLSTFEERILLRNLDHVTGFACYPAEQEWVLTNSRVGYYQHLKSGESDSFPCMNFGVVPHIRFLADQGLLYSTGPVGPALNILDKSGSMVDKLLLDSPVISASEGLDHLFFVTLSQDDKEVYKLYFYSEEKGVEMALFKEDIQTYTTFGHYFIALLSDGTMRTYSHPTRYAEVRFDGPKNHAVFTSLDNRFIVLLRNEGERQIFRAYRNHEVL